MKFFATLLFAAFVAVQSVFAYEIENYQVLHPSTGNAYPAANRFFATIDHNYPSLSSAARKFWHEEALPMWRGGSVVTGEDWNRWYCRTYLPSSHRTSFERSSSDGSPAESPRRSQVSPGHWSRPGEHNDPYYAGDRASLNDDAYQAVESSRGSGSRGGVMKSLTKAFGRFGKF